MATPKNPTITENTDNMSAEEILDKHFEKKTPKVNKTKSFADKKKLEKIVINEVKKAEKIIAERIEIKSPDIEYVITETTKYDLNWFYLKQIFVRFERWLISPYTKYTVWFNAKFNKPKDTHFLKLQNELPTYDINELLYEPKKIVETKEIKQLNKKTSDKLFEIVRSDK